MLTEEQILDIVQNLTLDSFDNDIKNISNNSKDIYYPILISRLDRYVSKLSLTSNIPVENEIYSLQYDLYNVIREILKLSYGLKYRISMHILHSYFAKYGEDALEHRMVMRYDLLRYVNTKHQVTFKNLTYIFGILSLKDNRISKVIDALLPELLSRDVVYITDKATDNLYKFYREG